MPQPVSSRISTLNPEQYNHNPLPSLHTASFITHCRVIPAAADAALGADVHSAAAAKKAAGSGGGRGSFAAKFAKIHEKLQSKQKPLTSKSAKEVKAAKESKAFDFTAPAAVAKQPSKPFNGVFTGGVTAKQPFVPKTDPLSPYQNPVKSVFTTAFAKPKAKPQFDLKSSLAKGNPNTKVGPKVAIPPAKAAAAAAAAAASAAPAASAASPAKPVKSPVKKVIHTKVTAGDRAGKAAAAAKEATKQRLEQNRRRKSVELPEDMVSRTT